MAEVALPAFLGGSEIGLYYIGDSQVAFNPFTQGAQYTVRNDAFSASLKLAMPYSAFNEIGMQSYTSSIDGLIRNGNINDSYMIRLTSSAASYSYASASVVSSGSSYDWSTQGGYTSSLTLSNSAVAGVILTSSAYVSQSNFVVETWFRKDENFTNPPFHKQFFGNNTGDYILCSYSTGNVFRFFINGQNGWTTTPNATLVNGTWYHIAFAKSGTTVRVYLNGQKIGEGTRSLGVDSGTNSPLFWNTIGQVGTNNDNLRGANQDYRFYLGTDKNYTGSVIPVPDSIVIKS